MFCRHVNLDTATYATELAYPACQQSRLLPLSGAGEIGKKAAPKSRCITRIPYGLTFQNLLARIWYHHWQHTYSFRLRRAQKERIRALEEAVMRSVNTPLYLHPQNTRPRR
jgi:hypothetical protein